MSGSVFEDFLSTPEMTALFGERAVLQAMMDFEAALARSLARVGVLPASAAQAIASLCRVDLYDLPAIVAGAARSGSLAIPLVAKLGETVALFDAAAAGHVHWGSTSQDVIDTAMVLQTRRGLALIEADLLALAGHLLDLAERHADTPLLARTLLQPALVSSLRFKLLGWAAPLLRSARALRELAGRALVLQLGGAVGTQAAWGESADAICAEMARELQLPVPLLPWATQRDAWLRLGTELGVLCGSLGKLARDLALMAQAEVGELAEPAAPGRGGSSAMPHKRNPVACMLALAAAQRAPQRVAALLACMPQEHERGLGGWQAELAEWSALMRCAHGSVQALARAFAGLQVFPARMRANIEAQRDLVYAEDLTLLLARVLGRPAAHAAVEGLCAQSAAGGLPLRELARQLLAAHAKEWAPTISPAALEALFDMERVARRADARAAAALAQARQDLTLLLVQTKSEARDDAS